MRANLRRVGEVSPFPDLEFGAGKTSITAGRRSEAVEAPARRAISAFFVGGEHNWNNASNPKSLIGDLRSRVPGKILRVDLRRGGEVSPFPDLEFGTGKTSTTAGHGSETLAAPATRAISAFFVGGDHPM